MQCPSVQLRKSFQCYSSDLVFAADCEILSTPSSGRNLWMHQTINGNWEGYCRVVIIVTVEKYFHFNLHFLKASWLNCTKCLGAWVKSLCELADGECLSYDWVKFWCEDILWYWSKYWLFLNSVLLVFPFSIPSFPLLSLQLCYFNHSAFHYSLAFHYPSVANHAVKSVRYKTRQLSSMQWNAFHMIRSQIVLLNSNKLSGRKSQLLCPAKQLFNTGFIKAMAAQKNSKSWKKTPNIFFINAVLGE